MATKNLKDRIARLERTQAQRGEATKTPEEEEAEWQEIISHWYPILDGICGPRGLNKDWRLEFPYPDSANTPFRKVLWLDAVCKALMPDYRDMKTAHNKSARGLAR
ncbi:MAG: hypothetical protein ACYCSN_17510 [Acidobacteriaceae bacterium]